VVITNRLPSALSNEAAKTVQNFDAEGAPASWFAMRRHYHKAGIKP